MEEDREEESKAIVGQYVNPQFWDEYYENKKELSDLYLPIDSFYYYISKHILNEDKNLYIGAGMSSLPRKMIENGYSITCIDISDTAIKNMNAYLSEFNDKKTVVEYIKDDVFKMKFKSGSFEKIIDKGLLDCILSKENGEEDAIKMLIEVQRVLCNKGKYICASHSDNRASLITKLNWDEYTVEKMMPKKEKKIKKGKEESLKIDYKYGFPHLYVFKKN